MAEPTYVDIKRAFEWDRREMFNFSGDVIDRWAMEDPDKRAMLWVDDSGEVIERTFKEISITSKKLCNVLRESNIRRNDTILTAALVALLGSSELFPPEKSSKEMFHCRLPTPPSGYF